MASADVWKRPSPNRLFRFFRTVSRVILKYKSRRNLSDDFFGGVLLNFLCTRVPCHDVSGRLEQVDGVLFDAIHQNVELFRRSAQC